MNALTHRRRRVYNFILDYKRAHDGCSPNVREIMRGCGYRSTSAVSYILQRLVQDGLILLDSPSSRSIRVVGGQWQAPKGAPALSPAVVDKSFDVSGLS